MINFLLVFVSVTGLVFTNDLPVCVKVYAENLFFQKNEEVYTLLEEINFQKMLEEFVADNRLKREEMKILEDNYLKVSSLIDESNRMLYFAGLKIESPRILKEVEKIVEHSKISLLNPKWIETEREIKSFFTLNFKKESFIIEHPDLTKDDGITILKACLILIGVGVIGIGIINFLCNFIEKTIFFIGFLYKYSKKFIENHKKEETT